MIQWDEQSQCLTDYMGYPISRTVALEYRQAIKRHLQHSAADLAGVALRVTQEKHPGMLPQLAFVPGDYE